MSNYIERFSTSERVLHWIVTACFAILVLTGIGLYSTLFNGYFAIFGGGRNAILIHKIAGVVFFFTSIYMYLNHRKDVSTFDEDDRQWIEQRGGYLSRSARHFNIGKYNPGQKLFAIFIALATLVLGITGLFIWAPTEFPRGMVQLSLMLHGSAFVAAAMFMVVHVYLATIGNPGTLESMMYGDVRRKWAKHHHPKWYKELTGEKPEG